MSSTPEIAIIGVGLHPFGRYEDRSALEMGAVAISTALRDAGGAAHVADRRVVEGGRAGAGAVADLGAGHQLTPSAAAARTPDAAPSSWKPQPW